MRIAFLNWRDSTHPEGGSRALLRGDPSPRLVARGREVTLCLRGPRRRATNRDRRWRPGASPGRPPGGLCGLDARPRARRAAGAARTTSWSTCRTGCRSSRCSPRGRRWSHWSTTCAVAVAVVFGPVVTQISWLIGARLSPRVYRGRQYVAVSERTREELVRVCVQPRRVAVIHDGADRGRPVALETPPASGTPPSWCWAG